MALYSWNVPHERRAAEKVYRLISTYSYGVSFEELMRDNKDEICDRSSVLASIGLLTEGGQIRSAEHWKGEGFLERIRLFVGTQKIPEESRIPLMVLRSKL